MKKLDANFFFHSQSNWKVFLFLGKRRNKKKNIYMWLYDCVQSERHIHRDLGFNDRNDDFVFISQFFITITHLPIAFFLLIYLRFSFFFWIPQWIDFLRFVAFTGTYTHQKWREKKICCICHFSVLSQYNYTFKRIALSQVSMVMYNA